jgi:hypothetical protein
MLRFDPGRRKAAIGRDRSTARPLSSSTYFDPLMTREMIGTLFRRANLQKANTTWWGKDSDLQLPVSHRCPA